MRLLTSCAALTLILSVCLAQAGECSVVTGVLTGTSALGEVPSLGDRHEAENLLKQAQLRSGNSVASEKRSGLFSSLMRRSSDAGGSRPDPFKDRGAERRFELPAGNDKKARAQRHLEQGRAALTKGAHLDAVQHYHEAVKLNARFAPSEYSPADLAADLRGRGVNLGRFAPAAKLAKDPIFIDPFDDRSGAARRDNRASSFQGRHPKTASSPQTIINPHVNPSASSRRAGPSDLGRVRQPDHLQEGLSRTPRSAQTIINPHFSDVSNVNKSAPGLPPGPSDPDRVKRASLQAPPSRTASPYFSKSAPGRRAGPSDADRTGRPNHRQETLSKTALPARTDGNPRMTGSPHGRSGDRSDGAAARDVMQAKKTEALALLARARAAQARGDIDLAYQFAVKASELDVPESAFGPGEPRPSLMRMHLENVRQRRGTGAAHAGAVRTDRGEPRSGVAHGFPVKRSIYEPGSEVVQQRHPVVRSIYDSDNDSTRNVLAQGQDPIPSAAGPNITAPNAFHEQRHDQALRLIRQGEKALTERDLQTAGEYFHQAWKYESQLDPATRTRLKDHMHVLRSASAPPRQIAPDDSSLEEISSQQQMLLSRTYAEVTRENAVADRMRPSDPIGARKRLVDLREKIAQSQLERSVQRQLVARVDRSIEATDRFIEENRAQIELDSRNAAVLEKVDRQRQVRLQIQDELAMLVEKYNTLMDERRWEEAEVLARQAHELAPESEVARTLTWQSRFVRRWQMQMALRDEKEEGFWRTMQNVGESAVPFDDRHPYQMPERWDQLTEGRLARFMRDRNRRLSEEELKIQQALKMKVDVRFENRPLAEVVHTLARTAGVNVYLDPVGMSVEGVTSDTPVTIQCTQPISLRSALKLILEQFSLSYVIQDEVLKITSEQTREANVFVNVYDVADLVIPIPNFVPDYEIGLAGAIREAHAAVRLGMANGGANNVPLMLAESSTAEAANPSRGVMANMMNSGQFGSMPSTQAPHPLGYGPGGLGGASQADFDTLINLITSTIAPTSWVDAGGAGSVEGFDTNLSLVISQTQEVHEEIVDLLEQLRRLQDLQVTIEVRFIRLNDQFFERIGIDFDFDIDDNFTGAILPDDTGPSLSVGLDPTGAPTADLDLSFNQHGMGRAVPQFGGFDAASAATFGFAILSDIETFFFIEAAQGDQRTSVMQAPKVTLFNGQQAFVSDTTQRPFVTSVIPVVGDFAAAHQPVVVVLNEGTSLSVQAVVSPDRRFVRLTLVPFFSRIGQVDTFTFNGRQTSNSGTNVIDPTDNTQTVQDGAEAVHEGTTIQLPTFSYVTVTTTVSVPDGGTVLLGGVKRLSEGRSEDGVPMLSKIPYINRLFRNVGIGRTTESLLLMVTPRIIIQEEEEEKLGIPPPP